jgi:hypothetical protein
MDDSYEIGYRKPPTRTRFQPGRSGNPRGRPRGAKNLDTILRELAARQITVTEGGKSKRMSLLEALLRRLSGRALQGDHRSMRMLLDVFRDVDLGAPTGPSPLPDDDRRLLDDALKRMADENEGEPPAAVESEPPKKERP